MRSPRLGVGTPHTLQDQIRWYREQFGDEKTEEQIRLARLEQNKCVCVPQKLKRRWDGDKLTTRSVHASDCPKHKGWMDGA